MPDTTSRSTISRQWELLRQLPARAPGMTSQQLAERLRSAGFTVSKRTVERDLNELSQLFMLHCNERSKPYGWYWKPGGGSELPGLTVAEALTLQLVESSLHPLLPAFMLESLQPRFAQARSKLASLSPELPAARWPERIASVSPEFSLLPPRVDSCVLENIQQALLDDLQLHALYQSAGQNQPHERVLNPLALIQRGQVTYLVATVEPWHDPRLFALHRFQRATPLHQPVRRPEGFVLADYIASGALQFSTPGATTLQLQARVSHELARQLGETPLAADMQLGPAEADGLHPLTATLPDTWQLRWWLLSQAGAIAVLQPASLRHELNERLRKALQLQQDAGGDVAG